MSDVVGGGLVGGVDLAGLEAGDLGGGVGAVVDVLDAVEQHRAVDVVAPPAVLVGAADRLARTPTSTLSSVQGPVPIGFAAKSAPVSSKLRCTISAG